MNLLERIKDEDITLTLYDLFIGSKIINFKVQDSSNFCSNELANYKK